MNPFILFGLCVSLGCLAWTMLAFADWLLGDSHLQKLPNRRAASSIKRQGVGRFHVHGV
jgi:hypothetical protein